MILRLLFAAIGYTCVATIISLAAGAGYLLQSGQLNDEKMFRIMAILHNVDLEKMAASQAPQEGEIPDEEPSYDELRKQRHLLSRDFEVRNQTLNTSISTFLFNLDLLTIEREQYSELADNLKSRLEQTRQEARDAGLTRARQDIEQLKPNVAKDLLMKMDKDGNLDQVVLLLTEMSQTAITDILQKFRTEPDLEFLDKIHQKLIQGYPETPVIDQVEQELNEQTRNY